MKQKFYKDGSPSREVEECICKWCEQEPTGGCMEDFDNPYEGNPNLENLKNLLTPIREHVRTRLSDLQELILLCRVALTESHREDIKECVANILWTYVHNELETAKMEIEKI